MTTGLPTPLWRCWTPGETGKCVKIAIILTSFCRTNTWTRLPDMLVPRIQPTVVAYDGMIYAMGGRNSNKVCRCAKDKLDPLIY